MPQAGVIDGLQFARDRQVLQGRLDLSSLPRLADMGCSAEGLDFTVRGALTAQGKPCLQVSISGMLQLVCQRCLGPVAFRVAVSVELELCDSLRAIEEADDDVDRVLATRAMGVARLLEDEVILALPMVARHESCAAWQHGESDRRASPFSVLSKLKQGR